MNIKTVCTINTLVANLLASLGRDVSKITQAIEATLNAGKVVSQDSATRNMLKDQNADTTHNVVTRAPVSVVTAFHEYAGDKGVIARHEAKALKLGFSGGTLKSLPTFRGHDLNAWIMRESFAATVKAPAIKAPKAPKAPKIEAPKVVA